LNDGTSWKRLFISSLSSAPILDLVGVFSTGTAVFRGVSNDLVFVDGATSSRVLSFGSGAGASVAFQVAESDVVYLSVPTQTDDLSPPSNLYAVTPRTSTNLGFVSESVSGIWADAKRAVFVAGNDPVILEYSVETKSFHAIPDVPDEYWLVWGLGEHELWLSQWPTTLVHFSGDSWESFETALADPIEQIWGAEDTLYFRTLTEFGRITPEGTEIIVSKADNLVIHSMWGRASNEVFLNIEDASLNQYKCGGTFIAWFDGEAFHVM
jgi:hypothetical protein